jgi:tRNA threonylcarbamoyladenosine biosynthesis protein TsaB
VNVTLGIDCASGHTGIGLVREGRLLGELNLDLGRSQAGALASAVGFLLSLSSLSLQDLERIAVTTGPGYYTGLRIGVSYACALAEGLGVPVTPVPTLLAMVAGHGVPGSLLCPILHARAGWVYSALYGFHDGPGLPLVEMEPKFISVENLFLSLQNRGGVLLVGEDAARYPLLSEMPRRVPGAGRATGASTALLGSSEALERLDPSEVRVCYLREPDVGNSRS